ncbi:MAG: helix-turn-helix domain-containing protein [Candidatus Dadabacteria bacterium]|nr:MAG: helix-turn-helix domain-containing protein [Candidatus Dadabacteria bacterium]
MKIRKVSLNNRKRQIQVTTASGKVYPFPYAKLSPKPTSGDKILDIFVDKELGNEAFTYVLKSGKEGSVHIEQVLEYNQDPTYLRDLLLYKLTLEAIKHVERSGLSRRELARRLGTSVTQLYRLLNTSNTRKSMNQLVSLLHVLGCEVEVTVTDKAA